MQSVLILCTGNSCRSQMAEAWMRKWCRPGTRIASAGLEAHGLNPHAMKVLQESGLDTSPFRSKTTAEFAGETFDLILTVCDHANEHCPYFPGEALRVHQHFTDPARATGTDDEKWAVFRKVNDEIGEYCRILADRCGLS